jgi:UV DNA damage endonuclease
MIPFASHPVCDFPWQERFEPRFGEIGRFIRDHDIRISMHPDQFTLINAVDPLVVRRGEHELLYHAEVLDLLGLDLSAKIQIHVGGVYGDKEGSIRRFIDRYWKLDEAIRRRLVIENDGQLYALHDCMKIHERCGIPVLFDAFHHNINSSGEDLQTALSMISRTWVDHDGIPMVDYSNHKPGGRHGAHAERIDLDVFKEFLKGSKPFDFDLMLEIKDKERSAAAAVEKARSDPRFAA